MAHVISQLNVDGINRYIADYGYAAKRGKLDPNEIIVAKSSNALGCITIKLADDPSANNRPTWYVGIFRKTTPKELSDEYELVESPNLQKTGDWNTMLKMLAEAILSM